MSEPQVWTLLGVFSAVLFAVLALMHRSMKLGFDGIAARIDAQDVRINAQGERLESRIDAQGGRLESRIDGLETKIDAQVSRLESRIDAQGEVMAARFDDVDHRLSNLEDDMRLVKGHLIGERSA